MQAPSATPRLLLTLGLICHVFPGIHFVPGLQTPLWVCLACPIVLGMLVPFAFNGVLGELAQHLCDLYQLPTDECNELWCVPLFLTISEQSTTTKHAAAEVISRPSI